MKNRLKIKSYSPVWIRQKKRKRKYRHRSLAFYNIDDLYICTQKGNY